MRISNMLYAIASWLESPDNEAMLLAEYDEDCLNVVAKSCVEAAEALKVAAERVESIEPEEQSSLTPESLEQLANIATAFDSSDDEELKKQASVIDELLLTIAAPPDAFENSKKMSELRIEELKKKYHDTNKTYREQNKIADVEDAIKKSKILEPIKINTQPLSSRYCPDHPGAMIARIGEHKFQCELDNKIYDFESGFELDNGQKVPGGDVSLQNHDHDKLEYTAVFDTREGRLGSSR